MKSINNDEAGEALLEPSADLEDENSTHGENNYEKESIAFTPALALAHLYRPLRLPGGTAVGLKRLD